MEQRKSLTLAQRVKLHPVGKSPSSKTPATRNQSAQNKPQDTRKGKRRSTGKRVAASGPPKARQALPRKKPGRAKQTQPKPPSKKKRNPK